MQVRISRWGNSLGLRIPKDAALQLGISESSRVEVSVEGDRLIVSPDRPRYRLAELLTPNMTPKAMRSAFDWGDDIGRENVE